MGTETDSALSPLPSAMARWSVWRSSYPDGAVLARPQGRDYSRDPFVGYDERIDDGSTPFPVSPAALADDRLSPGTRVIAVSDGADTRAWPIAPPIDLDDRVGDRAVRVVTDGTGGSVTDAATGEGLGTRTSLWFAIVAAYPDVTVGSGSAP